MLLFLQKSFFAIFHSILLRNFGYNPLRPSIKPVLESKLNALARLENQHFMGWKKDKSRNFGQKGIYLAGLLQKFMKKIMGSMWRKIGRIGNKRD